MVCREFGLSLKFLFTDEINDGLVRRFATFRAAGKIESNAHGDIRQQKRPAVSFLIDCADPPINEQNF